jgi:hypothetical protein
METFELEQSVWDDTDFARMGWHDAKVWAYAANPHEYECLLDLDYIFKWVQPEEGETHFKFWIAPVTMVFEDVHGVTIDLESSQGMLEIAQLYRENPALTPNGKFTEHTYRFECQEGLLSLNATGFKLYVRKKPQLVRVLNLGWAERGGIGFGRELTG